MIMWRSAQKLTPMLQKQNSADVSNVNDIVESQSL